MAFFKKKILLDTSKTDAALSREAKPPEASVLSKMNAAFT